jgi:hypothetical protein
MWFDNNTLLFYLHLKVTCDFLPPLVFMCFLPFEQVIEHQMVQLQSSIWDYLHHHTLFYMYSNERSKPHHVWILSCSGPWVNVWFTSWLVFPTFQLFSSTFSTTFRTWLKLPHPLIVGILRCMCTHPIDPMGIHLLHCTWGNKQTKTHDVVCNIFVVVAWNVDFCVGWK